MQHSMADDGVERNAQGWPIRAAARSSEVPPPDRPPQPADAEAPVDDAAPRVAAPAIQGDENDAAFSIPAAAPPTARFAALELLLALSILLEVLTQIRALMCPSPLQSANVERLVSGGIVCVVAATTVVQVVAPRGPEILSVEVVAALLQLRPVVLLWRSVCGGGPSAAVREGGRPAGLELELSPEMHRLSVANETADLRSSREGEGEPGQTLETRAVADGEERRRDQRAHEAAELDKSVGAAVLLRSVPVSCLLALRWWAALGACLPGCTPAVAAAAGDTAGTVGATTLSLLCSAMTVAVACTRACAGELQSRADRAPRCDPPCLPGLTFATLLLCVTAIMWLSAIVRLSTLGLYVVILGESGGISALIGAGGCLTVLFYEYLLR